MSLFEKIFGNEQPAELPDIRFGRYSDIYHSKGQDESFDQSVQLFEREKFKEAYLAFFNYLKNDDEGNMKVWVEDNEVKFELYQGSKKIIGYGNSKKLFAEARIAKAKTLQASFMRRLLEKNYELKYSRFAVNPDNEITIIFDTYTIDGSPFKLYAALKELATQADKLDDILVDEFEMLTQTDISIRRELPEWEKEIKYQYIISEISAVFDEIDNGKINTQLYPVAITYLFLYLCYKLDYLTKPEGFMMETLERAHRLTFEQDGKNVHQKNLMLRKEFQLLLDRPKEKYFKEMYEVKATFGITAPIDHQKVALIIEQELANMQWYIDNGHDRIALSIPGFIAGRCLFYFAVPKPDKDLFHLLIQIMEPAYFKSLGFASYLNNGKLDEKGIKKAIKKIVEQNQENFPTLRPDLKILNFSSLPRFAQSFCWMIKDLDV